VNYYEVISGLMFSGIYGRYFGEKLAEKMGWKERS
jgi:hypothetical protein